jgi:hypothetical protein
MPDAEATSRLSISLAPAELEPKGRVARGNVKRAARNRGILASLRGRPIFLWINPPLFAPLCPPV